MAATPAGKREHPKMCTRHPFRRMPQRWLLRVWRSSLLKGGLIFGVVHGGSSIINLLFISPFWCVYIGAFLNIRRIFDALLYNSSKKFVCFSSLVFLTPFKGGF